MSYNVSNLSFGAWYQEFKNGKALPNKKLLPTEHLEIRNKLNQIAKDTVEITNIKKTGILPKTLTRTVKLKDGTTVKTSYKINLLPSVPPVTYEISTGEKFIYKLDLMDVFDKDIKKSLLEEALIIRELLNKTLSEPDKFSKDQIKLLSEMQGNATDRITAWTK
jgi:hypothetical protein